MGLAITLDKTLLDAAGVTTETTASFSPTASALLVVGITVGANGTASNTFTISDTFSGTGTWTKQGEQAQAGTIRQTSTALFTAKLGSSPGSGTVTVSWTNTAVRIVILCFEVTGYNTTTPVAQAAGNKGTASTLTVTLGSSPASDSLLVGMVGSSQDSSVAVGSGFTELTKQVAPSSTHYGEIEYENGSGTTTVNWTGLGTDSNAAVGIEINNGVSFDPATIDWSSLVIPEHVGFAVVQS